MDGFATGEEKNCPSLILPLVHGIEEK